MKRTRKMSKYTTEREYYIFMNFLYFINIKTIIKNIEMNNKYNFI